MEELFRKEVGRDFDGDEAFEIGDWDGIKGNAVIDGL